MKTPIKVSIKVQRIIGPLCRMSTRMLITFKCIFLEKIIFDFFWQKDNIVFVTSIHTCIRKISCCHVFLEKDHLSFSVQRIRSYFREKEISSFLIIQERSYSSAIFLEIPCFQNIWKKKI